MTVGRKPCSVKTGGRKRGSLDKGQRQVVTSEISNDILSTYMAMGGPKFLLAWAQKNESEFVRQCLSKFFPKDGDVDVQFNQQVNNYGDERGAALRVAFALNKAMHDNNLASPVAERVVDTPEVTPQQACRTPQEALNDWQPHLAEPVTNPDRQRWVEELPLTPEERRDAALVRETRTATIENYRGGPGEQGGHTPVQRQSVRKPTVREIQNRRREDLL